MQREFRTLVQGLTAAPVNWLIHPQGEAWPGVVLNLISHADTLTQQGPDHLWIGRVQVDCYARAYLEASEIANALIAGLHGFRGGGFQLVRHLSTATGHEPDEDESERISRVRMDFQTAWSFTNG